MISIRLIILILILPLRKIKHRRLELHPIRNLLKPSLLIHISKSQLMNNIREFLHNRIQLLLIHRLLPTSLRLLLRLCRRPYRRRPIWPIIFHFFTLIHYLGPTRPRPVFNNLLDDILVLLIDARSSEILEQRFIFADPLHFKGSVEEILQGALSSDHKFLLSVAEGFLRREGGDIFVNLLEGRVEFSHVGVSIFDDETLSVRSQDFDHIVSVAVRLIVTCEPDLESNLFWFLH